jgi:protocatechuate 3,4-dioxygenase beta subunit
MTSRILALAVVLLLLQQQSGVGTIEVSARDDINRVPLQNVRIQLLSYTGDASKNTGLSAITDDAGQAVFVDLPYGNYGLTFERSGYRLSSAPPRLVLQADKPVRQVEVALGPTSTMMGRVLTSRGNPLADVEVSAVPIYYPSGRRSLGRPEGGAGITSRMKTNATGEFRLSGLRPGEYYIRVDQSARLAKDNTRDEFVRLSYYPGVVDPASAVSITLRGQDVTGIDVKMPVVPAFKISGTVFGAVPETDSNGNPYQGFYIGSSDPDSLEEPVLVSSRATRGTASDEMNFEIGGISPGSYFLYPLFRNSGLPPLNYSTSQFRVIVDDRDVTELRILDRPMAEINGRVTINGDVSQIKSNNLRLQAASVGWLPLVGNPVITAPVSDSSSREFTLKGLVEDQLYNLAVSGLPANTFIADIRQGATSLLHDGAIRASTAYGTVDVIIDTRGGGVHGVVRDASNQSAGEAVVVLIPPAAYRSNPLFHKRVRANAEGRFTVDGIRPGEYSLLAFPTLPPGQAERNERFMTPYYSQGTPVTIRSNAVAEVELRVVSLQ